MTQRGAGARSLPGDDAASLSDASTPTERSAVAPSLRWRLLAATLVALALALVLAGVVLNDLFRQHVLLQQRQEMTQQLDQLTARLAFDVEGRALLDDATLADPRWSRPLSGLYWQLDRVDAGGAAGAQGQRGVLRSRSLWDETLALPDDVPADGTVHAHELPGPRGATLRVLERSLIADAAPGVRWRLAVAADSGAIAQALARFRGVLAASLAVLGLGLGAAALAQVAVGLAPLQALRTALQAVRDGRAARLAGRFPSELQPLVDDFNGVLARNEAIVERARTQAGNLAHAIKTPLAVLQQAATEARRGLDGDVQALPALVDEQVQLARRQVDWHLAQARAAAAHASAGQRSAVAPVVDGLLRVMARVHAQRALALQGSAPIDPALAFAGEPQDLQQMVGNLLDNACKWAARRVQVSATRLPAEGHGRPHLEIEVVDDGPGIAAERREAVLRRGTRLDESVPGSGLGLAIVVELATLYGGTLQLDDAAGGGLRARLRLPAAA